MVETETPSSVQQAVVFIGPDGIGKSLIARGHARKFGGEYISTGEKIRQREQSNEDSDLKRACDLVVATNTYLAPYYLNQLLVEELSLLDPKKEVVLDGALRTLGETEDFDRTLSAVNSDGFNIRVVYLKGPLEVAFRRARKRGSKRDAPSAILSRHAEFLKDLQKRLGIIRQRYDVIEVDGTKSAWHVARDVRMALMPEHYEVVPTELGVRQIA